MLVPNNLNLDLAPLFSFADARAQISSIGMVNGRLHMQVVHEQNRTVEEAGWAGNSRLILFAGSLDELNALRAERNAQLEAGIPPWEIDSEELWNGMVQPDVSVRFYMNGEGDMFHLNSSHVDEEGAVQHRNDPRHEVAFGTTEHIFDINPEGIQNYTLMAFTFSYQNLPVSWSVSFTME